MWKADGLQQPRKHMDHAGNEELKQKGDPVCHRRKGWEQHHGIVVAKEQRVRHNARPVVLRGRQRICDDGEVGRRQRSTTVSRPPKREPQKGPP